jgi:hypothetical protein
MRRPVHRRGFQAWEWVCLIVLAGLAVLWLLPGCAGLGYATSAASAGASEWRFREIEERLDALEMGDIW